MTWVLHGFNRLPAGANLSNLIQATNLPTRFLLSKTIHSPMNLLNKPVNFKSIKVTTGQQHSHFSSSSWSSQGGKFHSRPGSTSSRKNNLLYPVPVAAGYSTFMGTVDVKEGDSTLSGGVKPCELTVGAAWAPKRPRGNCLPAWCDVDCGEDAFFTIRVNNNYCLGVADGVGGWSEVGVDPSQFAWELINTCKSQCKSLNLLNSIDPKQVLTLAYEKLVKTGTVKAGSSTACLAVVDTDTGILKSVNLGDSGYLIIRNGTVAYRSKETTHYFNAPYQLSIIPPELDKGGHIRNYPKEGVEATLQLEHGDLIVMGTDGLFDNLFDCNIESLAVSCRPGDLDELITKSDSASQDVIKAYCNTLAGELVKLARRCAVDKKRDSPFSTEASKHGYRFKGGKMDDITVLTAMVCMKKGVKSRI